MRSESATTDTARSDPDAAPMLAPLRSAPDQWPFHSVYLWDAPSRVAPALIVLGLAASWATAGASEHRALHRALDMALPWLALFQVLWPLVGPRSDDVRSRLLSREHWRLVPARWSAGSLGPDPFAMLTRVIVLVLMIVTSLSAIYAPMSHERVAEALICFVAIQAVFAIWKHQRAGDRVFQAIATGKGAGSAHEALPRRARGVALVLILLVPACWLWQESRIGSSGASTPLQRF